MKKDDLKQNAKLKALLRNQNLPKDEVIELLCDMIENEVCKPESQIDYDLISELYLLIDELSEGQPIVSEDNMQRNLENIKKQGAVKKRRKRCSWIRTFAVVAASFVIMFSGISIMARVHGYASSWDFILESLQELMPGEKLEGDGITVIKPYASTTYATMEVLMKSENFDFLLPAVLPEGVAIETITVMYVSNDHSTYEVAVKCSDMNLKIYISTHNLNTPETWTNAILYQTDLMLFYIQKASDGTYFAVGQYGGFEYSFTYNDYNELTKIISSLKA